jgi:hypothetical protein
VGSCGSLLLTNGTEVEGVILATGRVIWADDVDRELDRLAQERADRKVGRRMIEVLFGVTLAVTLVGCGEGVGPTKVTREIVRTQPTQITATDAAGVVHYVCATQPREYIAPDGNVTWEVDHYIQDTPCPAQPID